MNSIDPELVLGYEFSPNELAYTSRDACLYALSIGFSYDPVDLTELNYTYEGAANFMVFPTFGINFAFSFLPKLNDIPGLNFERMMLLHGEQFFEYHNPIPKEGVIKNYAKISQVLDKGSGAVITIEVESRSDEEKKLVSNKYHVFIRGLGGFGGDGGKTIEKIEYPERPPDHIEEKKTLSQQALFYRLTGDKNPLHADPLQSSKGGFDRPILHGLCTFGFSVRALAKNLLGYDLSRIKSIQARFSSHVFPGETLITEMWQEKSKLYFLTKVLERESTVIKNAVINLE